MHLTAKLADQFGILDKTAYRNLCVRIEFDELINQIPAVKDRIEYLQNKYHLGYERIKEIVYPRGEEKQKIEQIVTTTTTVIIQKQRRIEPRRK